MESPSQDIVKKEFLVDDDFYVEIKEENHEGFISEEEESRTQEQDWIEDNSIYADSESEPSTSGNSNGNNFSSTTVQGTTIYSGKRTTNRNQFSYLVNKMKENPDIAQNNNKRNPEEVRQFWEQLQKTLNTLGPPIKNVSEWKKVWSDHKCYLKRKTSKLLSFSAEEEEVLKLIRKNGLEEPNDQSSLAFPKNVSISPEIPRSKQVAIEPEEKTSDSPTFDTNEGPRRKKICLEPKELEDKGLPHPQQSSQMELLRKQIQLQENLYNSISKVVVKQKENTDCLNLNLKNIFQRLDNLYNENKNITSALNALLNENIRHNKAVEKIAQEKLMLKKKILEVEIKKLELKEGKRKK